MNRIEGTSLGTVSLPDPPTRCGHLCKPHQPVAG
jgi:hypothetical protein